MLTADHIMSEEEEILAQFIEEQIDAPVIVKFAKALAGGASRDTWLVEGLIDNAQHQWVLRRDLETEIFEDTRTRAEEFMLLQIAEENSVIVPHPLWLCMDANLLGKPFFLMDYVDGLSIGVKVVNAPQLQPLHLHLPPLLGQQLAHIHSIDVDDPRLDFLPRPTKGRNPVEEALASTRQMLERLEINNPTMEFGMRWLEQNAPTSNKLVLVHGDYRIGNFLVGERGLHAVIDWEFSHVGDPHEDLAWGCVRDWRFGRGEMQFGGISDREPYIQAYEATAGVKINRDSLDYWEILGNMRWAVTCLSQADRFLSGGSTSVEFASLGRRSAEMQLEFLNLINAKGL